MTPAPTAGSNALVLVLALGFAATLARATDPDILSLERRLWELTNGERKARRLAAYEFDEELSAVARAHSRDMATNDFFEHDSPRTGSPQDRIFKAGLAASATAENIARDESVAAAHKALMLSEGHRENILSPTYDRMGVGIVRVGRSLWITQNFRLAIKKYDIRTLPGKIARAINLKREKAGLPPLTVHPRLTLIAGSVASRMNSEQRLLASLPGKLLDDSGLRYREFWSWVTCDASPRKVVDIQEISRAKIDSIGVGVVENRSQARGLGMLWMAVLLARLDETPAKPPKRQK